MFRTLIITTLLAASVTTTPAADLQACLTRAEQRLAVDSGKAVRLSDAINAVRAHGRGRQVVKAQLCHDAEKLVYVLTVLARDGKVTHARVDAVTGNVIGEL